MSEQYRRCCLDNETQDENGKPQYKKNFLGLSDNVTYFVEQLDAANVSKDHYRVVFKPSTILPDVDVR